MKKMQIRMQLVCLFSMLLLFFPVELFAQQGTITGKVVDERGESVIGATVMVKGSTDGTITDLDGNFKINGKVGTTITVSYVGYAPLEVKITKLTGNRFVMKEDSKTLDEVVVVGMGTQKRNTITAAVATVNGDAIATRPVTDVTSALQGNVAGLNFASDASESGTGGEVGGEIKFNIRGIGSINGGEPYVLVDGVEQSLQNVNPADIESIDILKDAASAAIYGAQAANGVVLITTKSGKEGKAQISFDAYYGVQTVARKINMLNAKEYMTIMDEQAVNSGNTPYDWSSFRSIYDANGNVHDTDWIDSMFKDNARTQSYTLGITGGSQTSTYALSLGYMSQEGVVGGKDVSNYERYNFRINSEHKIFKDSDLLKVGEQVSFVYKMNNGISVSDQYNNTLRGAFATSPLAPIYSDNNAYDSSYNDTSNSDWYNGDGNPYGSMMTNSNNENKTATFSGNVYAYNRSGT